MNFRAISDLPGLPARQVQNSNCNAAPGSKPEFNLSRRQFARVAGAAAFGATFGSSLIETALGAHGSFAPVPIPGGTPALGGSYHVFGPAPAGAGGDPIDAEPSTITNFNGFVGLAYISGLVTQTNTRTGVEGVFPFKDSDMRFMEGVFRGTDGRVHQGAFAFV